MKTIEEAVQWVESLLAFGIKPGLERMEWMLEKLGNPQKNSQFIHVGGTNGKGSTVSFLRHTLVEANYNVGTFTSPYIEKFNERIMMNGEPIPDADVVSIANDIKPLVDELAATRLGSPTEFEVITVMAFVYFSMVKPDIVVMEVGLGGRLDSTNVLTPMMSLLTNVGFDHVHILGETKQEIAKEKAGIIKKEVPVITTAEDEEVVTVFQQQAVEMEADFYQLEEDFTYDSGVIDGKEQINFRSSLWSVDHITLSLKGKHQVKNVALAMMALALLKTKYGFELTDEQIRMGIEKTSWPGRFEQIEAEPTVILDGAHNPEGIEVLKDTLQRFYGGKRICLLFAATVEKDVNQLLHPLYEIVDSIIFTTFDFSRAQSAEQLYTNSTFDNKQFEPNWKLAIQQMRESITSDDILLITGSLYFIGEVRKHLLHQSE